MAKQKVTKNKIRMRRRMRKTLGVVCLITAIVVAAIPVPSTQAATGADVEGEKYTWDSEIWNGGGSNYTGSIPVIDSESTDIYTTGDGTFQFAYITESSIGVAVILGYNGKNLENNYLEIPDDVNAYMKYNSNQGSFEGYVAANKKGLPLYYATYKEVDMEDAEGNKIYDALGNVKKETVIDEYLPCYYNDRAKWQDLDLTKFYFNVNEDEDAGNNVDPLLEIPYRLTTTENNQWIKGIKVYYIGNQTIKSVESTSTGAYPGWEIVEDAGEVNTIPLKGVFANNTNIKYLKIGEYLKGIGNYAFYACGGLESVTLGNGLEDR